MSPDEIYAWMTNPDPSNIVQLLDKQFMKDFSASVLRNIGHPCRMCKTPTKRSFMFCSESCFNAKLNQDEEQTGKRLPGMRESLLKSWHNLNDSILTELKQN